MHRLKIKHLGIMSSDKSKERPLISPDWALKSLLGNKANLEVVGYFFERTSTTSFKY